jgi:hypothetical protein
MPASHVCVAAGQSVSQSPQWSSSVSTSTHAVPQSAGVALGHSQAPPLQVWVVAGQLWLQPPQWLVLVDVLTQAEPHTVNSGSVHAQLPASHCCAEGQTTPQAPQLVSSCVRSTQLVPHVC